MSKSRGEEFSQHFQKAHWEKMYWGQTPRLTVQRRNKTPKSPKEKYRVSPEQN